MGLKTVLGYFRIRKEIINARALRKSATKRVAKSAMETAQRQFQKDHGCSGESK